MPKAWSKHIFRGHQAFSSVKWKQCYFISHKILQIIYNSLPINAQYVAVLFPHTKLLSLEKDKIQILPGMIYICLPVCMYVCINIFIISLRIFFMNTLYFDHIQSLTPFLLFL